MSESRVREKTKNFTALEAQIHNFPENRNVSIRVHKMTYFLCKPDSIKTQLKNKIVYIWLLGNVVSYCLPNHNYGTKIFFINSC